MPPPCLPCAHSGTMAAPRPLANSPRTRGTSRLFFPVQVLLGLGGAAGLRTSSPRNPAALRPRRGGTGQGGCGTWAALEQQTAESAG